MTKHRTTLKGLAPMIPWMFVTPVTPMRAITPLPPAPPEGTYTFWVMVDRKVNSEAFPCATLAHAEVKRNEYTDSEDVISVHIRMRRTSSAPPPAHADHK